MALVRLETQHHPAGELRPATPTCCGCCCCCCVGATLGSVVAMTVVIASAQPVRQVTSSPTQPETTPLSPPRPPSPPAPPMSPTEEPSDTEPPSSAEEPVEPKPLTTGVMVRILGGPAASILLLFLMAGSALGGSFYWVALILSIVPVLGAWANVRLHAAGKPFWPVSLFVLGYPFALIAELYMGLYAVLHSSATYLVVAVMIFAAIVWLGLLIRRWCLQ